MTTDYNPIAEQYQRAKQQPWREYLESFSLLELIGDVTGLRVLDLACGEGFYTRLLRQRGAARVLGVEYHVGDAREVPLDGECELVVAAYLLNYARTRAELQQMYEAICRCLVPGGRFVTVNTNPALDFSTAPSYRRYGFETALTGEHREGAPLTWTFHLADGPFSIENYILDREVHEAAMRAAGLCDVRWIAPRVSPEGLATQPPGEWTNFLMAPPVTLLECRRARA